MPSDVPAPETLQSEEYKLEELAQEPGLDPRLKLYYENTKLVRSLISICIK